MYVSALRLKRGTETQQTPSPDAILSQKIVMYEREHNAERKEYRFTRGSATKVVSWAQDAGCRRVTECSDLGSLELPNFLHTHGTIRALS